MPSMEKAEGLSWSEAIAPVAMMGQGKIKFFSKKQQARRSEEAEADE